MLRIILKIAAIVGENGPTYITLETTDNTMQLRYHIDTDIDSTESVIYRDNKYLYVIIVTLPLLIALGILWII